MLPRFWVASIEQKTNVARSQAGSLGKSEGRLWLSVIAGQKQALLLGGAQLLLAS